MKIPPTSCTLILNETVHVTRSVLRANFIFVYIYMAKALTAQIQLCLAKKATMNYRNRKCAAIEKKRPVVMILAPRGPNGRPKKGGQHELC